MINLSRLEEIKDLRTVWPHEALDFTPWLSQDDNISLLADAVGMDITVDETEASVGDFNVDIFASETGTDRKIIIENQLEDTNHDHLGKLITYASGKSADVVIWVVKHAREEHKAAMLSIGGYTVKNNLGGVVPYVIVRTNQKEVDSLLGSISETAPSAPKSGDFWYKIDHTEKSVTLMKYNGTSWTSASEKQSLTYTWYAQDKDGKEMTFNKTGKVIYLSAADIDSIMTLQ